jgi:uncharacterized protein
MIVLSSFTVIPLLEARRDNLEAATFTPDLGLSMIEVTLSKAGIQFQSGEQFLWPVIEEIAEEENACFLLENGTLQLIRKYSPAFDRFYSLYSTESAPTMLISGIPMHRIKGTNPRLDTQSKIKALAPIGGDVLDTTTGLGYTAIEAAKTASQVTTIELDPTALEIARLNPWSQGLFNNPKIQQVIGDSFEEIDRFSEGSFSAIIHDPPMFSLAGDLYSKTFYQRAFGVLKRNGKLFHYIGDPESKSGGRITAGVIRRLKEAGFRQVIHKPQAFGVVAYK